MARFIVLANILEEAHRADVCRNSQRRRVLRREGLEYVSEGDFIKTYRLSYALFDELIDDIEAYMKPPSRRSDLSISSKVLAALSFYATGSYQTLVGQNATSAMSQASVSRSIEAVTEALNHPDIHRKYIRFPQNADERNHIKMNFYRKFRIPGVIGCVDGTHIAIRRPKDNEERYWNRKWFHSRNVQIICDSDLSILNVDASFGGATHDSFIWNVHPIKDHLINLTANGEQVWLLGDSGYPQREYMMTPVEGARDGTPEAHYSDMQRSARNTVERAIGVLKARWRCLLSARELHYEPIPAARIINACCVLHNICNRANLPVPELTPQEQGLEDLLGYRGENQPAPEHGGGVEGELLRGRQARAQLVVNLWEARRHAPIGNI